MPRKMKWGDRTMKGNASGQRVRGTFGQTPMQVAPKSRHCLWFVKDPPKRVTLESWADFTCGKHSVDGFSYCEEHKNIAYRGIPPKIKVPK